MVNSVYMVYILVYSAYATYRRQVSVVDSVYIPVYSVYAIYRGVYVSTILYMVSRCFY